MLNDCFTGDCGDLNQTTCEFILKFDSENDSDFLPNLTGLGNSSQLYDDEGCFDTFQLRQTQQYETYKQVGKLSFLYLMFAAPVSIIILFEFCLANKNILKSDSFSVFVGDGCDHNR